MKWTRLILLLVVFIGCGYDQEYLPQENGDLEEEEVERAPNPLEDFDLTYDGADEPLVRDWEFVNFQNLETGELDYRTPMSKLAHAIIYNGGYENNLEDYYFPLFLRLTEVEGKSCEEDKSEFGTRTHAYQYLACYSFDESSHEIRFTIDSEMREQIGSATSFAAIEYEVNYLQALQNAYRYEISSNRLYIYMNSKPRYLPSGEYRMVFLAWDEEDELKGD
ncbi:hypothetical protein [Pleomorphovibrio marinus]|uniref:hypothetical protein n=1 Tax=Pleomorphovibrio marinus TaxID=2164132 RepID=UPI000E0A8922|nr:hypothetical protein [Pleomorphovibrio marinus]